MDISTEPFRNKRLEIIFLSVEFCPIIWNPKALFLGILSPHHMYNLKSEAGLVRDSVSLTLSQVTENELPALNWHPSGR